MKWRSRDTMVAIIVACILTPVVLGVRDAATVVAAIAAAAYITVDYISARKKES